MAAKDVLGRAGEDRAARYLQSRGYTVIDRNWRVRDGEIDLVVTRPGELVVVEVKTRRGEGFGHPFEAIDARKQRRLWHLRAPRAGLDIRALRLFSPQPLALALQTH